MNSQTNAAPGAVLIQAKTLDQAIAKASAELGTGRADLGWEVLREESAKGFLSFFKSGLVEIRAWVKPKRSAPPGGGASQDRRDDRRPKVGRSAAGYQAEDDEGDQAGHVPEPLAPEAIEALKTELADFCAGICSRVAGEPVQVSTQVEEGRLVINVESEYVTQQISRNSKLAEALEHILRKKPRHLRQELPFRIFVDVGDLRKRREADLVQMAHDLSAKVHENKRPIVLNYKSSYDRKIIHMALDKDERVYTKSIGSGPNRKLMILPSRGGSRTPVPDQVDVE